jgi:hypothetical protein
MKTFIEFCEETKKELPVYGEILEAATRRIGIAHWAYPDGYIRSHYPAGYFMPTAADALQKMGPKADEEEVDHGDMTYQHHEKMIKSEKTK